MEQETHNAAKFIAIGGGALVGSFSAVAIKQPANRRELFTRAIIGVAVSVSCTGFVCEYFNIAGDSYSKISGVAIALSVIGWHFLSIVMVLLDSILEKVNAKKLGFLGDLLAAFRGNPAEILKGPDVVQVTQIKQTTTVTSPAATVLPAEAPKE